jgi:hypothetical protein
VEDKCIDMAAAEQAREQWKWIRNFSFVFGGGGGSNHTRLS